MAPGTSNPGLAEAQNSPYYNSGVSPTGNGIPGPGRGHGGASRSSTISDFSGSSEFERLLLRKVDRASKTEVAVDMDDAIKETGHGKFQYCLWLICGLIYSCCSISTTTLSFVLPAATCDFHLSSSDKGLLNIMPVAGMMIGSYLWGFFADSKGRRFVLISSLLTDGTAGIVSSFCQGKIIFLIIRVFNGLGIIGSVSVVFAYLGEFLTDAKRDKALSSLEFFWTFGILVEPVIGYIFIPQKWVIGKKDTFIYNSWRLYVFLCALPSLILGLVMIKMPESPRFLLLQGKLLKARTVLQTMFKTNTGRPAADFPVQVLLPSAQAEFYFFKSLHDISTWVLIRERVHGIYKLHVFLFSYCMTNILLTSYIDFALNCCYNTLINWLPELLNTMSHWEERYGIGYTVCEVEEGRVRGNQSKVFGFHSNSVPLIMEESYIYQQHAGFQSIISGPTEKVNSTKPECQDIENGVFIETFIVCLCCLPTTIATLYCIQYISKKILLIIALGVAGLVTFLATFVEEGEHLFYLMCMFEAFTTVVEAVLFCIIVEIFPDQVRGIALCLTVTIGRLGAVVGNYIFGSLINSHCLIPFYLFTFLLTSSCVAVGFLPAVKLGH